MRSHFNQQMPCVWLCHPRRKTTWTVKEIAHAVRIRTGRRKVVTSLQATAAAGISVPYHHLHLIGGPPYPICTRPRPTLAKLRLHPHHLARPTWCLQTGNRIDWTFQTPPIPLDRQNWTRILHHRSHDTAMVVIPHRQSLPRSHENTCRRSPLESPCSCCRSGTPGARKGLSRAQTIAPSLCLSLLPRG